MRRVPRDDYVRDFLEQILHAGILLGDLVDKLAELLPDDAHPGETDVELVLDMMTGTLRPLAEEAGEEFVRSVIALVADAHHKVLTDLRLSVELAHLREQGAGQQPLN